MDFTLAQSRLTQFEAQGLAMPYDEDLSILGRPVQGDGFVAPNAFCIQPMEGCDGTPDGSPDELTLQRYDGFAKSGAGLIWAEAVAVTNEGRANPRQLHINEKNYDSFAAMRERISQQAGAAGNAQPLVIIQLTHSGRFANPSGNHDPICGWRHVSLDERYPKQAATPPVADDTLRALPAHYAKAVRLARRAGFDGVDVKACHLYLFSELLSAYDRPGPYGGSFENRTRLLRECVAAAAAEDHGVLSVRLNVHDAMPMGFGVKTDGSLDVDFTEPRMLLKILADMGVRLLDVTMGTPYYNPHVNRPYNSGGYAPPENQNTGVARLLSGAKMAVEADSRLRVVGTGYTQLAGALPPFAAGSLSQNWAHFVGIGRLAFAYPSYPADALAGEIKANKLCLACGKCTELMRAGSTAGCPVRSGVYAKLYARDVLKK